MDEVGLGELNQVLLAESRGVVIDFWGTWCAPCRSLRPHLEQLAEDNSDDWRFVAVHVESHADVVDKYEIGSTPTLIFIKGGDEVHRIAGAMTPSTVSEALATHV
jgi:thioredoxin